MHHQVDQHPLLQLGAAAAQREYIHRLAAPAVDGARVVVHTVIQQGPFRFLGIVAVQLKVDVAVAGGGAVPDRAGQVRPEGLQPLHPCERQLTQNPKLAGLGVGAEHRNVLAHGGFDQLVVRQRGPLAQPQLLDGVALGGGVFLPLFHHQAGGHGGDLGSEGFGAGVHGRIVPGRPGSAA